MAIKVLRSDVPAAWHRARRELAALEALAEHPNVIGTIDLLELEQGPALVMEYAAGGSLADLIDDRGSGRPARLTLDEAVFVGRRTAKALIAAHAAGIVHRDVKPQNLLIDRYGEIRLCDFGIATLAADERFRCATDAVSVRYSSPEDLERDEPVGPASDIYSLGATLLQLVHGAPPTLRDRLAPWTPPPTGDPEQAALDAVIAACLEPDAERRPSAEQLLESLDDWVLDSGRRGVVALPVLEREAPLLSFGDVPIDLHEAITLPPPGAAFELERPVMLARPTVDGSRRAAVAAALVGVAAVLALVVAAVVVVKVMTAGGQAEAAGPPTAPRPSGLTPLTRGDWSTGDVGDCLAQQDEVGRLVVVECTAPHDLERILVAEIDVASFAEAVIAVDMSCARAFEQWVGSTPEHSELHLAVTRPSQKTWSTGDRRYHCYTGHPTKRLTAPTKSTNW